ncbi:MAG: hypothetical protein ACRCWC_00275, partial [Plesiomonas shigelloides]
MLDMFKDDATKMWSLARLSAALVLLVNFIYAAWAVFKTGAMPDIGGNWTLLLLALYGLNKAGSTITTLKAGQNE